MKKIAIAAVLAVSLVGASSFAAQGGFGRGFGPGFGPGRDPQKAYRFLSFRVDSALDEIDATAAQREKIHQLKDSLFADVTQMKSDSEATGQLLKAEWESASPDSAKVHRVIDGQFDAWRALAHKVADAAISLHDTLSAEQRAQLAQQLPPRGE